MWWIAVTVSLTTPASGDALGSLIPNALLQLQLLDCLRPTKRNEPCNSRPIHSHLLRSRSTQLQSTCCRDLPPLIRFQIDNIYLIMHAHLAKLRFLLPLLLLPAAICSVPLPSASLGVIPAAHCNAVGDGLKAAHVGNGAVFGVQVRDAFGKSVQVCDHGGHNFFVRARTLGASAGPWCQMGGVPYPLSSINSKVTCHGLQLLWRGCNKGTYAWEYVPQYSGFVELSVQVRQCPSPPLAPSSLPSPLLPSATINIPYFSCVLLSGPNPFSSRFLIAMACGRTSPGCPLERMQMTVLCCFPRARAPPWVSFLLSASLYLLLPLFCFFS